MAKIILKNSGVAAEIPTSLSAGELGINYEDEVLHWLDASSTIRETTLNPAGLASPAFTGTPTAPTAAGADSSTKIATTAFVQGELSGKQPASANLTSWAAVARASGFDTFAATPSSANLAAVLTDETGTGPAVFATSPTLTTPDLGTPSALVLTNATALPAAALVASTSQAVGFGSIELGHASDTTLARSSAGNLSIEGNVIYRAGGTDVPITDGGTGASTAAAAATNLGLGTGDSPQFLAVNIGNATDTTLARSSAGNLSIEGNVIYRAGGTDVALADGGTGASLTDPNADRIMFWDDSAGAVDWLTAGSGLAISGTTITASAPVYIASGSVQSTNATNLDFTDIPAYSSFLCRIDFASGNTAISFRVQLSSDNGSSFGSVRTITSSRASSIFSGFIQISSTNISGNKTITPNISQVPYIDTASSMTQYSTAATETSITGTINALRFTRSTGGSYDHLMNVTFWGIP